MTSSPITNVCKVLKESHIEKICLANKMRITMVVFCTDTPHIRKFLKRQLAVDFPDCVFILAALEEFEADTGMYTKDLQSGTTPVAQFIYMTQEIATITKATYESILETLVKLRSLMQPKVTDNRAPYEHQIEQMEQQRKIHDLHELEKIQKIKEIEEGSNEDGEDEPETNSRNSNLTDSSE